MAQETAQRSLRRAVARTMQRHYHFATEDERVRMHYAVFPADGLAADDPDNQLRQLFERAGIDNIATYAHRIFYPAANDPAAWTNANFEGLYASDVLGRNIYVLDDVADANGRPLHDLYILMPGFQQYRIERLTHNDFLAILRTPRFVRRGEMQVVHQQNGPIEVQNPIIIRRRQNHFDASYRRQRTSTGLDRLSAVPAHQWLATEDAHHLSPSTSAAQQLSPQLRVEVARQQQSPEHQRMSPSVVKISGERASGQMSLLAEDMENLMSPEKKRGRPSKSSHPRAPAFERQQREKAEKKKRCTERFYRASFSTTASCSKRQSAAGDSVQEQSLDDYASATAGLSRAQLKRLPHNVASQPSGDCCICKLEIRANNAITTLPCGHNNFHTSCLKKWLKTSATCPNCRAEVHL
uniref:RING-type domain-containing protein n=1 Tax=Globodera pallida TaxID=36090 RepID=A0A183CJT6_GLOPA